MRSSIYLCLSAVSVTAFAPQLRRSSFSPRRVPLTTFAAADDGEAVTEKPAAAPAENPFAEVDAAAKQKESVAEAAAPAKKAPPAKEPVAAKAAEGEAAAPAKEPVAAAPAKKAPLAKKVAKKAAEGDEAAAEPPKMEPKADGAAPAKKAPVKKAPPPKKEALPAALDPNYKGPRNAYEYQMQAGYEQGWYGRYDDAKTGAERSAKILARFDKVGGDGEQTRTPERVYAEIQAEKDRLTAQRARLRNGGN